MKGPPTWVLAHPTSEQERAVEPLADPSFHQALAAARCADALPMAVMLGERLAWRRGPGGRTVARSWADAGAAVTLIADSDPRHQAATRQLLVDGSWAVEQWVSRVRELGVRGVCWHTVLTSPEVDARVIADFARVAAEAGLDPMLRFSLPGPAADRGDTWQRAHDLLGQLTAHGAELSRLTVCLLVEPPAGDWGTGLDQLVENLRLAIPEQIGQLIVVVPRDRLHLAQGDAFELARAVARQPTPWPLTHCAGGLALVQAGQWWQVPERADGAGDRFETILSQLHRPTGPVFVRHHDSDALPSRASRSSDTRSRTRFDTSLFRRRSLFGSRTSRQR